MRGCRDTQPSVRDGRRYHSFPHGEPVEPRTPSDAAPIRRERIGRNSKRPPPTRSASAGRARGDARGGRARRGRFPLIAQPELVEGSGSGLPRGGTPFDLHVLHNRKQSSAITNIIYHLKSPMQIELLDSFKKSSVHRMQLPLDFIISHLCLGSQHVNQIIICQNDYVPP